MSASGGRDGLGIIAFASERFNSPQQAALAGLSGAVIAVFTFFIDFWSAVANTVIVPLEAMGGLLAGVLEAFIGGASGIIGQGAATSIGSLSPGSLFTLGPLTFAEGVAAAAAGLLVMGYVLSLPMTSDTIPFSFTDIPLIGAEEEDER